jgi:hypothetical protein
MLSFYNRSFPTVPDISQLVIFAYCLYMSSEAPVGGVAQSARFCAFMSVK